MSDLHDPKAATLWWNAEGKDLSIVELYEAVDAARRWLALTETGQRVEWCTNHDHEGDELSCWLVAWTSVSTPCDMRPALVIPADYLTEEE